MLGRPLLYFKLLLAIMSMCYLKRTKLGISQPIELNHVNLWGFHNTVFWGGYVPVKNCSRDVGPTVEAQDAPASSLWPIIDHVSRKNTLRQ